MNKNKAEILMDEDRHSTRSSTTTTLSSKLKRQPTNPQPFDIQKLKQKLPLIKKEIENVTMMKHMIEINLLDSVINCNLPNVRHQLENGSSISARYNNWSLLHFACALMVHEYAGTPEHLELVKYLLECGADINSADEDNWTALHFACEQGLTDLVRFLVINGADCSASTNENLRPIDLIDPGNHIAINIILQAVKRPQKNL